MLRIATIGTIAITENFIEVLNANDRAAFVGAQSRDAERAHAFTQKHGGERGYASVESSPRTLQSTRSTSAAPMPVMHLRRLHSSAPASTCW